VLSGCPFVNSSRKNLSIYILYYLEKVSIPDYSKDDYQYEEVLAYEERSMAEGDEDLEAAIRALRDASEETGSVLQSRGSASNPSPTFQKWWIILSATSLSKWAWSNEMEQRGLLNTVAFVPDAYTHNKCIDNEPKNMQSERDSLSLAAFKAGETLCLVQEKNRLHALKQLSDRYQVGLKQKMLISLEGQNMWPTAWKPPCVIHTGLPPEQEKYQSLGKESDYSMMDLPSMTMTKTQPKTQLSFLSATL
uniref:Uncharacterized protein n=1 Tax=Oncorhynchus kisutch TaxID=8019 RepID=A0A8C7LF06_ONCKI